jgi:hypothetical protein
MNWGKWIVVSFVLFALFIATLVTVCIRQDVSLVAKDYYQDELAYQSQIERMDNAGKLSHKPVISIVQEKFIMIQFEQFDQVTKGELTFFCPSNAKHDRKFLISSTKEKFQLLPLNQAPKGLYRAKMHWEMEGKEYYIEEVIYI